MEGYIKGEICNREGCDGIIEERDSEGSCSCHINPPCSYCETSRAYCPKCDWDGEEEQAEYHLGQTKASNEYYELNKERIDREQKEKELREEKFYRQYRGQEVPTELDYRIRSHTHFTQIVFGVFPPETETTSSIYEKVKGTFGGRFTKFNNYSFEFIAYTD